MAHDPHTKLILLAETLQELWAVRVHDSTWTEAHEVLSVARAQFLPHESAGYAHITDRTLRPVPMANPDIPRDAYTRRILGAQTADDLKRLRAEGARYGDWLEAHTVLARARADQLLQPVLKRMIPTRVPAQRRGRR